MEILTISLLTLAAFGLAAIPFSLLIGRWFLHDDIRKYGDGNPGAANVFRAGGQKSGVLAVAMDVGKGLPFVFVAHSIFDLSGPALVIIAVSAVLGHAFSPLLQWHGGKSIAVTFGVLLALPQHELLLAFIACILLGFLFIEVDGWTAIFGAAGSLAYITFASGGSWETSLMFCILVIMAIKQFDTLHNFPGFRGRLIRWVQSLVRGAMTII